MDKSIFKRRRRTLLLALLYIRRKKKIKQNILIKQRRKYWVHPILQLKQQGDWYNLIHEMRLQDDETFFNYMRMTSSTFENLLSKGTYDNKNGHHFVMGQRFYNKTMDLPAPSAISVRHNVPYVIVADEAFQLNSFTMRPYPSKNLTKQQRIFNYKLSRARRVVENAFGILASRWRIFHKFHNTGLETSDAIIKAAVCSHNILMNTSHYCGKHYADNVCINGEIIEREWRKNNLNIGNFNDGTNFGSNNYTKHAGEIRNTFTDYFINEDQVPWQEELI